VPRAISSAESTEVEKMTLELMVPLVRAPDVLEAHHNGVHDAAAERLALGSHAVLLEACLLELGGRSHRELAVLALRGNATDCRLGGQLHRPLAPSGGKHHAEMPHSA